MRIVASFILCSGAFGEPNGNQDKILKQLNVNRCMHSTLPLRWSAALAQESGKYAAIAAKDPKHLKRGFTEETVGGFDTSNIGQSRFQRMVQDEWEATAAIDEWFEKATSDDCWKGKTNECADFTQMVWKSSTHVGCGGWYQPHEPMGSPHWSSMGYDVTFVCNYVTTDRIAPVPNTPGKFDDQVRPRNEKTSGECDKEVTAQMDFFKANNAKKVVIDYHPDKDKKDKLSHNLTASVNGGCGEHRGGEGECFDPETKDCQVNFYRLVHNDDNKLVLVGMQDDFQPCPCSYRPEGKVHAWDWSETGVFKYKKPESGKAEDSEAGCLVTNVDVEADNPSLSRSESQCTDENWLDGGVWHFTQEGSAEMCMPKIPGTECEPGDRPLNVHENDFPVSTDPGSCSEGWTMKQLPHTSASPQPGVLLTGVSSLSNLPNLTTTLSGRPPHHCDTCRDTEGMGNFACSYKQDDGQYGCRLAPSSLHCTLLDDGEWCSKGEYRMCGSDGKGDPPHDDWATPDNEVHREDCSDPDGCEPAVCQRKMGETDVNNDPLARGHCYTEAQMVKGADGKKIPVGSPRGCDYGSVANTCAFDADKNCKYTKKGFLVTV